MGAISAIRTNEGTDAIPLLIDLIKSQIHRGNDLFGVTTQQETLFTEDLSELNELQSTRSAIAYNLMRLQPTDLPQPRTSKGRSIIVESDYTDFGGTFDELLEYLSEETPEKTLARFVSEFDGQYALAVLSNGEIFAARDPVGLKPLYYCSEGNLSAVSTESKGLWRLGVRNTLIFPPGHLWKLQPKHPPWPIRQITPSNTMRGETTEISERLGKLLHKSISERTRGFKRVGVSFSGGLDSSITAYLLSQLEIETCAFIVGVKGHPATEWAKRSAELLGIKAETKEYELDQIEDQLKKCLWRIEEANQVKLGVSIPLSLCAKLTESCGVMNVFTGQGADELFAGYHGFLSVLKQGGERALEEAIFQRVLDAHKDSYQACEQATAPERVKMLHPFADWELITYGLSIPVSMKIESPNDGLRKRILRKACRDLGLPKKLADTPKKAIQYSTGVDKSIKTLAKSRGFRTEDYLRRLFMDIFKDPIWNRPAYACLDEK